jgi:histidine ammonia-lyase
MTADPVTLDARPLKASDIVRIARDGARVVVTPGVEAAVLAARAVLDRHTELNLPVYGLNTALGAGVDTRLEDGDLVAFQMSVSEGRAVGIGPALPRDSVRAMMAVRMAGMAAGGSGVSLPVFQALVAALNAGFHPVTPAFGSIGAADLPPLAHLSRGLLGLGEVEWNGQILPAAEALALAGLKPLPLGPKDGHAMVVANSLSVGRACLLLADLERLRGWALAAIALNFEAFRANVGALHDGALAARPAFGQRETAARLRALLAGSSLWAEGAARRVQDPLSYRCAPQVWGAFAHALDEARQATEIEVASSGDNPVVLPAEGLILSQANFDLTALVLSWERLGQALAHAAAGAAHRTMKIMSAGVSGLPRFLSPIGQNRSGFGPAQKTVSALEASIRGLAMPVSLSPMAVSDGVEDQASMAPAVMDKTETLIDRMRHLVAIELVAAAQAVDLRGVAGELGAGTRAVYRVVRDRVEVMTEDRAPGPAFTAVALAVAGGACPADGLWR